MVIDPGNNVNSTNNAAGRARANSAPSDSATPKSKNKAEASHDNVSLSVTGQNMAKLETAVAQSPEVNEAKVAEIKAAIASGSYQVNSDSIAQKMLSSDSNFNP